MDSESKLPRYFRPPVCCECGKELEPKRANYESAMRLYCENCEQLGRTKSGWKPIRYGKVAGMFVVKD
ncbi:MAG: hypothetical protein KDD66_07340 [Bdellovibrionales bacterium]|nr:hypothetical protein [Bdellovibrionales bacterium]